MILDQLHHLAIYDSDEKQFSAELRSFIDSHNASIQSVSQTISVTALVNILLRKEIISYTEWTEQLETLLSRFGHIKAIETNRDLILEAIEAEKEYLNHLKEMHEDHETREGTETELSSETINELFEGK